MGYTAQQDTFTGVLYTHCIALSADTIGQLGHRSGSKCMPDALGHSFYSPWSIDPTQALVHALTHTLAPLRTLTRDMGKPETLTHPLHPLSCADSSNHLSQMFTRSLAMNKAQF